MMARNMPVLNSRRRGHYYQQIKTKWNWMECLVQSDIDRDTFSIEDIRR